MKTAGIICEYNPIHLGHANHIEKTREVLGENSGIVCLMSGNYVQRGDFAVFNKHARAESAVRCGADLVLEIPTPYVLLSAEGFAMAGVYILDKLGICEYLSFGSESGDIGILKDAAGAIVTSEAEALKREWLSKGLSYASAQQKAADAVLGKGAEVLLSPNNLLGIEYLKAIASNESSLKPITIRRTGGEHDGGEGYSASALRNMLLAGEKPWQYMNHLASEVLMKEINNGRGPVSMKTFELAMMSRLRAIDDFSGLSGSADGLDRRFSRYTASEPTIARILESIKSKRYVMSRIRRMMICACLGISAADVREPPPYIRVLAMNGTGMRLLKKTRDNAGLPIITKPASVSRIRGRVLEGFKKESAATDFYVLAYEEKNERSGGQEWRKTPVVINN